MYRCKCKFRLFLAHCGSIDDRVYRVVVQYTFEAVKYSRVQSGFVQVMENLESHGICYFNFQAWKVMEFK